ncbi:uncharacterized protein LOC127265812 isoform X1 [Andrographis paniculata]|uniref:uncharacterized protein LOC127265812 isoform X1 n=1 Tax=Andrographis paniculata TaxID=175694 RepID=UPI0021E728F2|nr:uncharacterized protein LOC127265812 isoform X1 [Andrographis paniculata]
MVIQSYISHAELLLRNYISADPFVVYTSIIIGIVACKTVYELSHLISPVCFKSFFNLSKSRQVEWSNRAISTFHAVYVTIVSFYFVFFSDLYSTDIHRGPVTLRSSTSSTFVMGVSLGYFLSDLGMIIWCYPSLDNSSSSLDGGRDLSHANRRCADLHVHGFIIRGNHPLDQFEMVSRCSGNEDLQGIYNEWSRHIPSMAGRQNSVVHILVLSSVHALGPGEAVASSWCGACSGDAVGFIGDELDVVLENFQRLEEDISCCKEGVMLKMKMKMNVCVCVFE